MDSLSSTASLLILTSKEEEAEGLIRSLRNGGLAVGCIYTSEPERLEELTTTNPFELILCCEYDPDIDLNACMSQYRELDTDIPLVIIADGATESSALIDALRSGARDLTEHGDSDHLQLVVARELADFGHRRAESRMRERLEECEQRSRELVDASVEAVAFLKEGIHVQVNPAYQELVGFDKVEDLDGYPLLDIIATEDQAKAREALRAVELHRAAKPVELNVGFIRADGGHFEAHLTATASKLDGEPCVRITTREKGCGIQESGPGTLDADTGLPNRKALMDELDSRLAETGAGRTPFAVIYVGISVLPKLMLNRSLTFGLKAAAELGTTLQALAPSDAYIARICDDAYILLISDLEQAEAAELAAMIRRDLQLPLDKAPDEDAAPQCGTGLTLADSISPSASDLLDTVYREYMFGALEPSPGQDAARPTVPPESVQPKSAPEEQSRLTARIKHALDVEGFQLAYQPIVSLKGDSQESYNVLLRLRDDDRTLIEAKDFLPAAVESGNMVAIDRWVLRNAISEVAAQRSKGRKLNFFVNVSEQTLQEAKLLLWICDYLREYHARGNWLTLQILEEHARSHAAAFTRLSEGLRKVRCRVALNRFGEGPNPELLLRSLRLDFVKFPPNIGQGLAEDKTQQERLQELTKLCRDSGVKSVVTGVEDARSLTVLWTAGIDYVQGNFLQRPSVSIVKST